MKFGRTGVPGRAATVLALCLAAGCGNREDASRAFFEQRDQERRQRERILWEEGDKLGDDEIVAIVRESRVGEAGPPVDAWLEGELGARGGQTMFPRWDTQRRGATVFEVVFTTIHLDDDNVIHRIAVQWTVDVLTREVSAPEWSEELEESPAAKTGTERQDSRAESLEGDLE